MGYGRLIRVNKRHGDPKGIAYIVALSEPARAIDLIRTKAADPSDQIVDLGRVSDELLTAMKLQSGEFIRA
jgi:hypothetical protein